MTDKSLPLHLGAYPLIEDYALLSDCQSNALVSRSGAIDWCCMPTLDADTCFGRLLDWQHGGHCSITPGNADQTTAWHDYEDDSLILCTHMQTPQAALTLTDFFCMDEASSMAPPASRLIRMAQCVQQGERNWDYRYSWIRDSVFTVKALHTLGFRREARRFSEFIERAAAGSATELQLLYGLDGRRRTPEVVIDGLEGYRGARPVRVGNRAARQTQLDIYGWLLHLAWTWHSEDHPVDQAYWDLLVSVVETACERWQEADHGIWEVRNDPKHFVHSKVMCWVAVDRAIHLASRGGLKAPLERWERERTAIREAIEEQGYDQRRGIYVQAFGDTHLDAASLLLPHFGYIPYKDDRMIRTVEAICQPIGKGGLMREDGLLMRYDSPDGLQGSEGVFLPCSFWLAECLACQGQHERAKAVYQKAAACANGPGMLSEEMDHHGAMAGNVPQALTHVSQIMAWLALQNELHTSQAQHPE